MPRFIRGGRGLWRKAQSSRGLFPQSNEVKDDERKLSRVPTPRLNLVFKIITIIAIIFLIISFAIMMNIEEKESPYSYMICGIIGGSCMMFLMLALPMYILIYRMIAMSYYKHQEEESNDTKREEHK